MPVASSSLFLFCNGLLLRFPSEYGGKILIITQWDKKGVKSDFIKDIQHISSNVTNGDIYNEMKVEGKHVVLYSGTQEDGLPSWGHCWY